MSEPTPEIEEYLERDKAEQLADIEGRSVEIKKAEFLMPYIHRSIENFETRIEDYPVGKETRAILHKLIQEMMQRPDGILLMPWQNHVGRYWDYSYNAENSDDPNTKSLAINADTLSKGDTKIIEELFDHFRLTWSLDKIYQYTVDYVVWHELGHALSRVYASICKDYDGPVDMQGGRYPLEYYALTRDISPGYLPDDGGGRDIHVQTERFAEGLAIALLADKFSEEIGAPQRIDFINYLARRASAGQLGHEVDAEHAEQFVQERLQDKDFEYYRVGYGLPVTDPEELKRILQLTT